MRQDPAFSRELDRRAARALAVLDPFEAASHALRGKDPELGAALIRAQWLAAVLRGDAEAIAELAAGLPAPWSDDPEILAARAACLSSIGDPETAIMLGQRAQASTSWHGGAHDEHRELTLVLASLYVLDDAVALSVASQRAWQLVTGLTGIDGALRACSYLLIGWTELRLRHAALALPVLREATRLCRAEGLDDLADRAWANHAFALAFVGDFAASRAALAAAGPPDEAAGWRRSDGSIESFTDGWMRYWSGDPEEALDAFDRAAEQGGGLISYGLLARCWLVNAALDTGDLQRLSRCEPVLDGLPDGTVQGLPWHVYTMIARAGVAVARGHTDIGVAVLDAIVAREPTTPAADVLAAQLYWRCGRTASARAQADRLIAETPAYLRIGALVVRALCDQAEGLDERAHQRLEEALGLGAAQDLRRPFNAPDPQLARLLADHAHRGTRHDAFVAELIAHQRRVAPSAPAAGAVGRLTEREQQIAAYLQTTMTAAEIAAALHISPNTLKTHLRSLYAKLWASNRREAVRALRGLDR